jgi:hypothetical protein
MLCCHVPIGIRSVVDRFKDLFEGRSGSYNNLCALFCLFLFGLDELSSVVRTCPWSHSVSDLSRSVRCFNSNRFMRRLRSSILNKYKKEGFSSGNFCYAVDDTANPKYGKSIFRCGPWHSSGGPYHGQKILVIALIDIVRGIAIPIGYAIVAKEGDPAYIPAHKLACEILKCVISDGFPRIPVAADSWFDSVEFIADLEDMGLQFAGEIKGNRKVKPCPTPKVSWRNLPDIFQCLPRFRAHSRFDSKEVRAGTKRAKCFSQRRIWIKKRKSPITVIAVYNRMNSTEAFAYYATTDLSMAGSTLWETSRARWKIECLFRDLKQSLSFGRLTCVGPEAAHLSVCIPFCLITSLRLDDVARWGLVKTGSIGSLVGQIREIALNKSIATILNDNHSGLIGKLRGRRHINRLNQKPVDQPAEAA